MGWRSIFARMRWPPGHLFTTELQGASRHIVHRPLGDRLARWGDFLPGHGTILRALVPGLRAVGRFCTAASLVRGANAALAADRGNADHGGNHSRGRFAAGAGNTHDSHGMRWIARELRRKIGKSQA